MKKIILTALAVATIQFAKAQSTQAPPSANKTEQQTPTPEQVATRQSAHLQKVLTLTDDQKARVYQAIVKRATSMQQLRTKNGVTSKPTPAEIAPVKEKAIQDINTILTPEQQKKWEEYRLQQKQKQEARKNGANAAPVKLEPTDDGMKNK